MLHVHYSTVGDFESRTAGVDGSESGCGSAQSWVQDFLRLHCTKEHAYGILQDHSQVVEGGLEKEVGVDLDELGTGDGYDGCGSAVVADEGGAVADGASVYLHGPMETWDLCGGCRKSVTEARARSDAHWRARCAHEGGGGTPRHIWDGHGDRSRPKGSSWCLCRLKR